MPVPYTFTTNSLGVSAQVNANFDYLEGVVGEDSTSEIMRPRGLVRFGPSQTAQMSHITATSMIIGNNYAEQSTGPSTRKFIRLTATKGLALDLDRVEGFKFRLTFYASGDLLSMSETPMHIGINGRYIAVPRNWHFQTKAGTATSLSDYRLTYVALQEPIIVYQGLELSNPKETDRQLRTWGVPTDAIMVRVQLIIDSDPNTAAELYVVKSEATKNIATGVGVTTYRGKGIAEGDVVLGQAGYAGRVIDYSYGNIKSATFVVKGYWV